MLTIPLIWHLGIKCFRPNNEKQINLEFYDLIFCYRNKNKMHVYRKLSFFCFIFTFSYTTLETEIFIINTDFIFVHIFGQMPFLSLITYNFQMQIYTFFFMNGDGQHTFLCLYLNFMITFQNLNKDESSIGAV